ncbi:MAG: 2-succinyl-5-enolpyruvyl-6-hydroxy-3-cyclohexene-1-carboxylic-acid synthase [Thermonemataceae bacterium]|nr:2-succinyl-5-enolpyruvyl-6-hydroxy-3-cyclohexene-1-carboxylic-acid synthase [Thermonemataceae bacterium]
MLLPALYNIAEICAQKGIKNAIISPGSRSAPLTLAFAKHPAIHCRVIADERSAAFIALGLAQQSKETVVLICTSGTASLNFAPAIAEAFFQEIPLLVLTADRPPEWIDQLDGQTIRQENIYGKHVKKSFNLPTDYQHPDSLWHINRIVNQAINLTQWQQKQPVHINIPIREPFYPKPEEEIIFDKNVRIIEQIKITSSPVEIDWQNLMNIEELCPRQLIVIGQIPKNEAIIEKLKELSKEQGFHIPVLADLIANTYTFEPSITQHDLILAQKDEVLARKLQPDLLITIGKSVISKTLKEFLRKYPPRYHWHIQEHGEAPDTFQHLSHHLPISAEVALNHYISFSRKNINNQQYFQLWQDENKKAKEFLQKFFDENKSFSEIAVIYQIFKQLPEDCLLHLANSMTVRYANYIGLEATKNIEVFANRGTSGIDGSTSTALGISLATDKLSCLITGDMAFLYDNNAFWHQYTPKNFRVIVLNNFGGGIFRILPNSAQLPALKTYFETEQNNNTEHIAKRFNLIYHLATDWQSLENQLASFFKESEAAKILEIQTDSILNAEFFHFFKKSYLENN